MIKKIRKSLFAKIFLITASLLFFMSVFVFALLAWLMPATYSSRLSDVLDAKSRMFIAKLEQVSYEDAGALISQFLHNPEVGRIELFLYNGKEVKPASDHTNNYSISFSLKDNFRESSLVLSNSYYFAFADGVRQNMLVVYGAGEQMAQLYESFLHVLPALLAGSFMAAFLAALLYSHVITKPVREISRIAEKMSGLQFTWRVNVTRPDEIGVLGRSLNELAEKLAVTISDLQNANKKLEEDIAHEKALEQAQLDFFSAVSHELKTPVTVIRGQLEGMLLGIGDYKNHGKYLARSLEITGTLENMVQEILTVSRLETDGRNLKKEMFDCVAVIREYLNNTEDLIVQKRLQLFCEMPANACICANRLLLEKVFSNLIGNAVKYSPEGAKIHIMVSIQEHQFAFSVENTGTRILESCMPRLFGPFYRTDQSRSRKTGGSGLGLYIVQKILCLHESSCSVCNTKEGVRFFFTLETDVDQKEPKQPGPDRSCSL